MKYFKYIFVFLIFGSLLLVKEVEAQSTNNIRAATWNIQNFGMTKFNREPDISNIVQVIQDYDIIAIQEISDIRNRLGPQLIDRINNTGYYSYRMSLSPRSGNQPNDRTKAEQYAFVYREDLFELLSEQLYNDQAHDYFNREPWIARFRIRATGNTFVLITIHVTPEDTIQEIDALEHVLSHVRHTFSRENNIVILGDLNASCAYTPGNTLSHTAIYNSQQYFWVVPDDADTTVGRSSCAYDRIITTNSLGASVVDWGIDTNISSTMSDHYPVWFSLNL